MIIIFLKEKVNVRTTISKCKNSLTKMAVLKMKVYIYIYIERERERERERESYEENKKGG